MERLLSSSSVAVAASRGGNWVGGSSGLWLVDWAPNAVWRTYGEIFGVSFGVFVAVISAFSYEYNCMQPSWVFRKKWGNLFQTYSKLHPLVSSPTILFGHMYYMVHLFFLVFTYTKKTRLYQMPYDFLFCLYYSWVAMMIELSIRELLHCTSIFGADPWDILFCLLFN